MTTALVILFVGLLVFLAHFLTTLFEKTRIPDVLPLVALGVLIGPVTKLVTPEAFGKVGPVFTTVALVIILFESGLGLEVASLREAMSRMLRLTLINFLVTMLAMGLLARAWLGLPFLPALALGAIVGGTSSAVVIPLVNKLRLQAVSRTILLLESTVSDVLCIVVTLGILQAIQFHELRVGLMVGQMLAAFLMATLVGGLGGVVWSAALSKIRGLQNSIFTTPAFVFVLFGITELLGYSGAIASLAFGVTIGNMGSLPSLWGRRLKAVQTVRLNETERSFFAEIVFVIKTFFFVYIGLSVRLTEWWLVLTGLGLTLFVFILRIPVVRLSVDRQVPRLDASLMAVMVPKGLAAALLASLPAQQGMAEGALIQDIVYAMILFSIAGTAILSFWVEKSGLPQPYRLVFSGYAVGTKRAEGSGESLEPSRGQGT